MNLLKKLKSSLELEFILTFCLFLIIIMFMGSFYITSKQKSTINELNAQKGKSVASLMALIASDAIRDNNVAALDRVVKTVLEDKKIIYILIEDAGGDLLNSFNQAFNVQEKEYEEWGIDPNNKRGSINNLLLNDKIYSFQTPLSNNGNLGKIYWGLSREAMFSEINKSLVLMILVTIAIIGLIIWGSHSMFKNLVTDPLGRFILASRKIASGDLDVTIEIENNNEMGQVAHTFNTMTSGLKSIITSIKELLTQLDSASKDANAQSVTVSREISDQFSLINDLSSLIEHNTASLKELALQMNELRVSSEETSASVLELVSSSSEIASNMDILTEEVESNTSSLQQISSGLNTLLEVISMISESIEETSSSASEIMASIKQIDETSEESKKLILNIKQKTEETGLASINETIEGMKKIKDSVELTGEVITILSSKSIEIDRILQVIDEVTDRTTLLSLNAAILAAQAGQHGKSFAVVASEIKNLASDTSDSTKEISGIINMIQKEIKTAVNSMAQGVEKVAQGFSLAEEASRIFNDIMVNTQQASEISEKIYRATQEQSRGIDIVVKAVQSIEERIGGLLLYVKEQKEAMDNMLFSIERMRDIARHVKNSTVEQKKASSEISVSAENTASMSSAISIALNVISNKSSDLLHIISEIKERTNKNVTVTSDMSDTINDLQKKALVLNETVGKFTE